MAFVVSDELCAKLRVWGAAFRLPDAVRDVTERYDACYLGGTIGVWWFVTGDGRVLALGEDEPAHAAREQGDDDACSILATAAWCSGIPELFALLPTAPPDAVTCDRCRGTHYVTGGDLERTLACPRCHGRGWTRPSRFAISPVLLEKLRAHREAGHARRVANGAEDPLQDEVERVHDAFLLDPGMGPMTYLTSDGRVLEDLRTVDAGDGVVEVDEGSSISAIVAGARKTGIGELLALLPEPPASAVRCEQCAGSRYWRMIVCPSCRGRGCRPA